MEDKNAAMERARYTLLIMAGKYQEQRGERGCICKRVCHSPVFVYSYKPQQSFGGQQSGIRTMYTWQERLLYAVWLVIKISAVPFSFFLLWFIFLTVAQTINDSFVN